MTEIATDVPAQDAPKPGLAFAHVAFGVALVPVLFVLLAMVLTHFGYIGLDLGFATLALGWGPKLATLALAVACLSLLISLFRAPLRYGPWALGAVVISGAMLGGYAWYQAALKASPPIADVATDWDQPLEFSVKTLAERGSGAKPVEDLPRVPRNESLKWGGRSLADINAATCPGAKPILRKGISESQVAEVLKAEDFVVAGGQRGSVEGTWQDGYFGFKTDLVVRLETDRIDLRSISRYNMPDMGLNCRIVSKIVERIKALPDAVDAAAAASAPPVGDDQGGAD